MDDRFLLSKKQKNLLQPLAVILAMNKGVHKP